MISSFGLSTIRYEEHPAFADIPFEDDPAIESLTREVSSMLELVRRRAKLPSTNVVHLLLTRIVPSIDRLFEALKAKNTHIDVFADFADRLKQEMLNLIAQDIGVFADRGTHAYFDNFPQADAVTEALYGNGFWLSKFPRSVIPLLEEAVAPQKELLWRRYQEQHHLDRENLSINEWDPETFGKLNSVFNNPVITTGISNYMGAPYAFSGCAFELSVPDTTWWGRRYNRSDETVEAAYYHLDMGSSNPKMICYLSEVTEDSGPTSLIKGGLCDTTLSWIAGRALDHTREDPNRGGVTAMASTLTGTDLGRRCFAALPKEMRCVGHFGNDILAGSPEEKYIIDHRTTMLGPAGTFVVFDGARIGHRGGIVKAKSRWAFQVIFSRIRA